MEGEKVSLEKFSGSGFPSGRETQGISSAGLFQELSGALVEVRPQVREKVTGLYREGGVMVRSRDSRESEHYEDEGLVVSVEGDRTFVCRLISVEDFSGDLSGGFSGKRNTYLSFAVEDGKSGDRCNFSYPLPPRGSVFKKVECWTDNEGHYKWPVSDAQAEELVGQFMRSKYDAHATRDEAAERLKEIILGSRDSFLGAPAKFVDALLLLNPRSPLGDFFDARRMVIHPTSAPKDVLPGQKFEMRKDLLATPVIEDSLQERIVRELDSKLENLYNAVMSCEGFTSHTAVPLRPSRVESGGFVLPPCDEIWPTKRGVAVFEHLRSALPVLLRDLSDSEIVWFWDVSDEIKINFPMSDVMGGVRAGFTKPLEVFSKDTVQEDSRDVSRIELLAQVCSQMAQLGDFKWRFLKGKSEALQELARLEGRTVDEVIKRYGL